MTNVTVSGTGLSSSTAELYADGSWAKTNATLANGNNSYTATAKDTYDRTATDSLTVNLPATNTFSYDGNGNLTNDGFRVFEYDFENQLTNVYVASAWRSEFRYDGFGRRRVRKEYTWQSSAWTLTNEVRYVYDGMLVVQERDANNLALVSYTRGNDLSGTMQGAGGIGGLLARTDNGQLLTGNASAHAYYHADGNGNITALVNTNGSVVARYNYDPYGNLLGMSGPLAEANSYRFSSKEYQANAGLYYYGFRFYEPNLQRWLNLDPIGEEGGINLYGFLFNDPINYYDPEGFSTGACLGDAALNLGVGLIPIVGLLPISISPVQAIEKLINGGGGKGGTVGESLGQVGNFDPSNTLGGAAEKTAKQGVKQAESQLDDFLKNGRTADLVSRDGFQNKTPKQQEKLLNNYAKDLNPKLSKLAKWAKFAKWVPYVGDAISFAADVQQCLSK